MKYYVRPIFSQSLNKSKNCLKLGSSKLYFSSVEIVSRSKNQVKKKCIKLDELDSLNRNEFNSVNAQLQNITNPRKKIASLSFDQPNIMGILNVTPDSFSDGGKYNQNIKAKNHLKYLFKIGSDIVDIGGESTRPGSKAISSEVEWSRIKNILKNIDKKSRIIELCAHPDLYII